MEILSLFVWWQWVIVVSYSIYFLVRAWDVWHEVNLYGIKKGYRHVIVGYGDRHFRLYHLVRTVLDTPPLLIGLLFPVLKKMLSVKLYTFKEEKKKG